MDNLRDFIERVFNTETKDKKREHGETFLVTKDDDDWKQLSWKDGVASSMFYSKYIDSAKIRYYGHLAEPNRPFKEIYYFAFLDKATSQTIKDGLYVVYLLSADHKSLLLCLAVGVSSGTSQWTEKIPKMKEKVQNTDMFTDLKNHKPIGNSDMANAYLSSIVCYKEYSYNCIPENEILEKDFLEMMSLYSEFLKENDTDTKIEDQKDDEWWPSLSEYNSQITKVQWLDTLNDGTTFTENALAAIASFYDYGGEATCLQLEEKYGRPSGFYRNTLGVKLAERVKAKYKLPDILNNDENRKLWPIVFQGREAKKDEKGDYVWKIRPELYEALTEFDILQYLSTKEKAKGKDNMPPKSIIDEIIRYMSFNKFNINPGVIENLYLSLRSKPFVILAGVSGTGKSRISRLFAEAVGGQFKLIPVKPDWSDASDLLGHVDLDGNFIAGKLTEFLYEANKEENKDIPFFVCLDEMNLARVEYYFSDFLSVIETRHWDDKHKRIVTDKIFSGEEFSRDKSGAKEKYGELIISDNVYVIGTVNMDETTYPFSKKVLDRANTIEFSDIDLQAGMKTVDDMKKPEPIDLSNSALKAEYVEFADCYPAKHDTDIQFMVTLLEAVNNALKDVNSQVAYRVRNEMAYYLSYALEGDIFTYEQAVDNELMQKILPRIQGSGQSTEKALRGILNAIVQDHSFNDNELVSEVEKYIADKNSSAYPYKRSVEKIQFMLRRLEQDGYTSYWL